MTSRVSINNCPAYHFLPPLLPLLFFMSPFSIYALILIIHSFFAFFTSAEPFRGLDYIQNGDFEMSTDEGITGWEISNSEDWPLVDGYSGFGIHLASTSDITPVIITQYLDLREGALYRLSFWANYAPLDATSETNSSERLFSAAFGQDGYWHVDLVSSSWENFSFEAHGAGNDNLTFTGYDITGGGFSLDNVTLVEISPISSSSAPTTSASTRPSSADTGSVMNQINVIWGIVGSVIGAIAGVATIYMCISHWRQRRQPHRKMHRTVAPSSRRPFY